MEQKLRGIGFLRLAGEHDAALDLEVFITRMIAAIERNSYLNPDLHRAYNEAQEAVSALNEGLANT